MGLHAVLSEEIEHALEEKRGACFSAVDPRADENSLLVEEIRARLALFVETGFWNVITGNRLARRPRCQDLNR